MAEDRFANVFSVELTLSAANTVTFVELNFGIQLRDRLAIVIDQMFVKVSESTLALMTANSDRIVATLTNSDQITDISDFNDRRNLVVTDLIRQDFGTAASGQLIKMPVVTEFNPPMIALPTRLFLGGSSGGLASAIVIQVRLHFRTVPITSEQMLSEVLDSFQLST